MPGSSSSSRAWPAAGDFAGGRTRRGRGRRRDFWQRRRNDRRRRDRGRRHADRRAQRRGLRHLRLERGEGIARRGRPGLRLRLGCLGSAADEVLEQHRYRVLLRPFRHRRGEHLVALDTVARLHQLLAQLRPDLRPGADRRVRERAGSLHDPFVLALLEPERQLQGERADVPRLGLQDLARAVVRLLAQAILGEDLGLGEQVLDAARRGRCLRRDLVRGLLELLEVERAGGRRGDRRGRRGGRRRGPRRRQVQAQLGLRLELPLDLELLFRGIRQPDLEGPRLDRGRRRRRRGRRQGLDRRQLGALQIELELDLRDLRLVPCRLRPAPEHLRRRLDLRRGRSALVRKLEHELLVEDLPLGRFHAGAGWQLALDQALVEAEHRPGRGLGRRRGQGRRNRPRAGALDRPLGRRRFGDQLVDRHHARLDLAGRRALAPAEAAHEARDLLRLGVLLDRQREQPRGRRRVALVLQAEHRVGDEGEVVRRRRDRLHVDLRRLVDALLAHHQLGDRAVLEKLLVALLERMEDLGELDVRRRVLRFERHHALQHADGGGGIRVLLVVVDQHLILRARLGDQALAVVELGQPLVDREPRRVELDDLLVDRDRLDEETVLRVPVGDLGEELDRFVDLVQPDVEVAHPVERRGVVRVLGEELAVLLDRGLDLPLRDHLLGGRDRGLAVHRHVRSVPPPRAARPKRRSAGAGATARSGRAPRGVRERRSPCAGANP